MDRLKNVLVGIDFSPFSRGALREAVARAHPVGAAVTVLHVVEPGVLSEIASVSGISQVELEQFARVEVLDKLHRFAAEAGLQEKGMEFAVAFGDPAESILRAARSRNADLIVLGSAGERAQSAKGGRGGSVAIHCARRAAAKVLLVGSEDRRPARLILAFVDFTEESRAVVDAALRVAVRNTSAIHFLHVYRAPSTWHSCLNYGSGGRRKSPDYRRALRMRFEEFVSLPGGIPSRFDLHEAESAGTGIATYARLLRPDLLIVHRSEAVWAALGNLAPTAAEVLPSILLIGRARTDAPKSSASTIWR